MNEPTLNDLLADENPDPETLAELEAWLGAVENPRVRPEHRARVLAAMTPLLPRPKTRLERLREWYPLALLLGQIPILRRELWQASALVLLLGLLATLAAPDAAGYLLFPMVAPLVAAAGVAVLYDSIAQSMFEVEDATRASGVILLLARLTLVFGFNLALSLASSVVLVLFLNELLLVPLIMSWLAPMTFLCGLAFFMGITTADPLLAAGSSLLIWLVHLLLRRIEDSSLLVQLISMPGLADPATRPLLMLSAALLVAVSLGLLDARSRRERRSL